MKGHQSMVQFTKERVVEDERDKMRGARRCWRMLVGARKKQVQTLSAGDWLADRDCRLSLTDRWMWKGEGDRESDRESETVKGRVKASVKARDSKVRFSKVRFRR
jgi:hypothetical protein